MCSFDTRCSVLCSSVQCTIEKRSEESVCTAVNFCTSASTAAAPLLSSYNRGTNTNTNTIPTHFSTLALTPTPHTLALLLHHASAVFHTTSVTHYPFFGTESR